MPRAMLHRRALLSCAALVLFGSLVRADDKPTLFGSWGKKDSEPTLEFKKEGGLTIYPHGDNIAIQIECTYKLSKDGSVMVKVKDISALEKVVEQVKEAVPIGKEFEFKWKVDGDKATLEEMEGKDVDHIKERLEGDYAKK